MSLDLDPITDRADHDILPIPFRLYRSQLQAQPSGAQPLHMLRLEIDSTGRFELEKEFGDEAELFPQKFLGPFVRAHAHRCRSLELKRQVPSPISSYDHIFPSPPSPVALEYLDIEHPSWLQLNNFRRLDASNLDTILISSFNPRDIPTNWWTDVMWLYFSYCTATPEEFLDVFRLTSKLVHLVITDM